MTTTNYSLYPADKSSQFHLLPKRPVRRLTAVTLFATGLNCQAGSELNNEQFLGKRLFTDKNLSVNKNQACSSCHSLDPAHAKSLVSNRVPGFVDPANVKTGSPVSSGSVEGLFGALNAPSAGYAAYSPEFYWDDEEELYIGGQFWNGRAANLVEQAKMPFLNPVEMAMPNELAIVNRLKEDKSYQRQFLEVYGLDLQNLSDDRASEAFDAVANAISAFEHSRVFNKFNSKFDYVLAGKTSFTPLEAKGFELFVREDKGNCAACHISDAAYDAEGNMTPPLFTDFSYDNIGLPRNINIPGDPEPNMGLGGRSDLPVESPEEQMGKHKVMSLRNIALTAPYGHNGSMATLEQIVHFYNTRDTLGTVDDVNHTDFGINGWPAPEVSENLNSDELGNLGLSTGEEKAIVAFLKTLTDNYPKWGHDRNVPPWSPSPFADPKKGTPKKARRRR